MKSFSIVLVACLHISVISFGLCYVKASAQLADTMECADESCSETISEGEARLAYRPRDDKFLNLKKGDVVLVKSKNAGKKSHLWGGQDFLEGRNPTKTEDVYSGLVGENQKITIDKTKKTKTEGKDKKKQETGLDEKARKEEQKLHDRKNDGEKGTSKDVSMEDNDKEHPTSGQRPKEVEPATPGDGGRSQQEPEQVRLKRNIEEHPDDGDATSNVVTPDSDFENAGRPKEENRNRESNGVEDTTDKQLKESEDGANDQSREEDGTMEEHQISSDLKDSGNIEGRHLDTTESNMEKDASKQIPRNEQEKSSDVKKQEAAKIPPDIAVLVGEDGVVGTELENEEIHPSKDSAKKGKSVARSDQQHENPKASDEEGHSKQLDQKDVEVNQDALNEKDQDTEVNKKSEDNDTRRENLTKGEKESRVENTKAGTVPPPVDVDSSKSVDDGPFEDDVDFEEGYYDNDKGEVEEETLPETGDFPHGSSKTDEKIYNSPTGQDSDDDAAELENASGPEEGDNQGKEHRGSIQQSPEADVQESDSNIKQNSTSTQENVETNRRESDPHEGDLQKEPASHRRPLEAVEEEKNGIKIGNSPDDEGKNQGEDGKHHDVQRKSDQSKTGRGDEVGDEHNSAHKDNEQNGEVGNDHDSAHGVDKGKTQFDEEPEHQAEERKTHPDASENNLDSDRKLVEEKMQSDKDNQYHADESKTRAKEENEKTQFDEESEHQAEQRKIHLDESGDDLDSAHKSVEEKVQSDKDNQHQDDENKARAKEPSIHHDEVGNDRDSALGKDKEKMEFDEESENQVKERKTHPDSSHNSEEKQVLHEQAAVISGANEHEVQARNTNSKPQASVESKVESNEEQQNAVPNKKEENSRSNETVLQMEAANLKETAAVENEQVIKPESDYEKYNALHEGEVVDWDEEIDGKAKKEKSVGWDETLGGDHVGDSHFVPSSTEKTLEEEGGEKEGRKENVLSESPIEDDVIEHSTVTPQPLDVEQITPTTPGHDKSHPSETRAKSDTATDEEPNEQGEPKSLEDEPPQQQQEKIERGNDTEVGESEESMAKVPEVEDNIDRELPTTEEMHVESFWLRLLLVLSNLPFDIIYILEPFFNTWVSLLPKEYHNDVHGVSWTIVLSTFFIGFGLIWFLTYRSISLKRVQKNERILHNIQELKTQLENLSQEKVQVENELRTKENEVEIQGELMATASEEKDEVVNERRGLEHSLQEFNTENEALKRDLQQLNHTVHEKDKTMQEILANSKQVEKSLLAQHEAIVRYEAEIGQLQESLKNHDTSVKEAEASADKLKERIKNLEKSKGEAKKEGKVIREQTEKLNTTINELQERLDAKMAEGEQQGQEIDVLKDCILQFKGAQDYLTDEGEDAESDDTIEKQKNKMKSMIDVANAKNILRQTEADKLQVTYELEAERKSRFDIEAKISELEALIQSDQAFKNKLERDKQMLESKLSVMQDFYAKREVEIQSKLGLEQSKRENNASMLEDRQKQHMEILQQLDAYKKMGEEAKQQYDDAERQHKQEILGFEKKAHDNWLACRDAERKVEEAHKQITQLHLELGDVRQRLRDSEREPILRPRPERHGPPGAPPPFGPPRRPPPPGMLGPPPPRMMGSPLHFRNGPEADRRSPPPHHRRPPSPSGSIPGSRPDRPPSTQSLPSMDRRLRPGPPLGPGRPYSPGRSYGDGIPPTRPPPRDLPAHVRPPPGARMQSGPMTSSPYMERPPMPRSQSPGPRFQNFTQSSLHATPPHGTGEGLRNDGYKPPPPPESTGPPPPNTSRDRDTNSSNPFRRSRP